MVKKILFVASIALLGAASVAQASAPAADDRWLPWFGCWRAADAPASNLLCILPEGEGVRILELVNGATVRESRTIADVKWRPFTQEGCSGNELARWSADGERLFLISDMVCNRTARQATGVFAFVSPNEWVSVQSVSVAGLEPGTRTVRYVNADASAPGSMLSGLQTNRLARETSRYSMNKPLDFYDIREAANQVNAATVEGLIIARKDRFDLSGKDLVQLANAGVPESVIDVMVAVTHPDRFEVRNPPATAGEGRPTTARANDRYDRYCDEWDSWYDRYCGGSRYGYFSSPFGYFSPFGYGSYPYYYNTPVIIVRGDDDQSQERGRATRRGYTRGSSGSSSGSTSSSVGSSSSGSSRSSGGSSSGSSSSGSSTGRTAKPRGSK